MGGGKKRIPPLYPVILMIVFSLALLPVQSKVRADDGPGGEDAAITVTINDSPVRWTDAEPFIDSNNRTMVPLRAVAEALDLTVSWDGEMREAAFTDGTRTIVFPIGFSFAMSDDGLVAMDTAAVIVNDRTYAPIRYLAEYFGYQVDWDGDTYTVRSSD